ncbi:helix-turn-helix transcriptional regulator [Streptomyces sp. P38-E01]|uniref:Helix-turn-helix transcriptional regulator n=1 Tax=Streptomyces tardus TaxID=2780544 RepID=A0A949JMW1_9ACTN|nr:helix-turn-helix transcriptional regulator [Streptomyces tardus]MBU7599079.1 helix-turn-helix transcriptional regulator [Streptomyces tardus]
MSPEARTREYRERPSRYGGGAVLWSSAGGGSPGLVLPDGCMDLIWHEAAGALYVAGPDARARPTGAAVPGTGWAGVRFAPGAAPALFRVPAHRLRDLLVPLDALLPAERVRRLSGQIAGASSPAAALERVALRLGEDASAADPLCPALVEGLNRRRSVADLARRSGLGERQLHRRSLDAFGYGLGTLGRILRFQRALSLASAGSPLAEVAYEAGYADQPHFARDVRALTGLPPTALFAARSADRTGPPTRRAP